jgi:hypothetical protein
MEGGGNGHNLHDLHSRPPRPQNQVQSTYMKVPLLATVLLLAAQDADSQTVKGCTDRAARNFNAQATENDGSCTYDPASVKPAVRFKQPGALMENSGMIHWNGRLWQHNDGGGAPAIYAMDTAGKIVQTVIVSGASNIDWEDIAQDSTHIYIGDFGNNSNGARTELTVYKVAKSDIAKSTADNTVPAETIRFRYADQDEKPTPVAPNTTDFDCEALIAFGDSLYLFTKEWSGRQTTIYSLPKTAGTHAATRRARLDVNGLVTGADIHPTHHTVALTGYTKTLNRFAYLLYDFNGNDFFSGNKRRIGIQGPGQTESVAFLGQSLLAIGSEAISVLPAKLETMDFASFLMEYLSALEKKKTDPQDFKERE